MADDRSGVDGRDPADGSTVQDFGPYQLERLLGRGGMGEVFRAFDTEHDRLVAVKRLNAHLAGDREYQERFRREARLAARLRNPHVIPIHRFGEIDGHLYIDMRYVEGFDAGDLIDTVGAVDPARAVSLVEQAASALTTAHTAGLVHRDVKPSNLLIDRESADLTDGFVYLADFGISRLTTSTRSHTLTRSGAVIGSLDYMAPEQFDGVTDPRVDIYSLTCVLFELLTGHKPYRGKNLPALMHAHLHIPPPLPTDLRPQLPDQFDDVIRRGMAKRMEERFTSAVELARAARSALVASTAGDAAAAASAPTDQNTRDDEIALVLRHRQEQQSALASSRHQLDDEPEVGGPTGRADTADHRVREPTQERSAGPAGASTSPSTEEVATPAAGRGEPVAGEVEEQGPRPTGQAANRDPAASADRTEDAGDRATADEAVGPAAATSELPLTRVEHRDAEEGTPEAPIPSSRARVVAVVFSTLAIALVCFVIVALPRSETDQSAPSAPTAAPASPSTSTPAAALVGSATPTVQAAVTLPGNPQGAAVAPDGQTLYVADTTSRSLVVLDVAGAPEVRQTVEVPGTPRYVAVSRDGRRVFVAVFDDDGSGSGVATFAMPSGELLGTTPTGPKPYALATAPDGRVWVPIHEQAKISVMDPNSLALVVDIPVPRNPHAVAFSPTADVAYTANHESNELAVIDTRAGVVTASAAVDLAPHSVAVSPDGRRIATANYIAGSVSILSPEEGNAVRTFPAGPDPQNLAWSVDGRYLYVVNVREGTVTAVEAATGQLGEPVRVGDSSRFVLASPDGTRLFVTSFESRTVSVLLAAA